MSLFFTEVWETLVPPAGSRHGPLPPLLVGMTLVSGMVDAFSYLVLGHVFVANMTGNVVFLGFALARTAGFSIVAPIVSLGSFWAGAFAGGRVGQRCGQNRGRLLAMAISLQVVLLTVAVILAGVSGSPVSAGYRYPLIVIVALAMGLQNATARELAVPDLTTTVLTSTITGAAAGRAVPGASASSNGRRVVSVGALLLGALIGAVFVRHVAVVFPLMTALLLLVIIGITARVLARTEAPWVRS